ncbi:hypothetical protein [Siminovitchia sp. 179-K 8D1 HS]|uniref:hypothetical protein n=1 Tax=Siminovitchia sp. 179-K 8D1 HS TaxID=3142385 RepID=UPI0039A37C9B
MATRIKAKVGDGLRFCGLDLSTKTGVVILDQQAEVVLAEEIVAKNKNDPERMLEIWKRIKRLLDFEKDKIIIEGFAYNARGQGVSFQYGLGWIVRTKLFEDNIRYLDVTPTQVKKFATNKGNAAKDAMVLPIYKKWGFEHDSDNVRDAYVLSRIGYSMYNHDGLTKYEQDILKNLKKI